MAKSKQYDNHLGILGWLGGGRWGVERYLYIIHRVAGLGILTFFMLHIFESSIRILGPESWNAAMETLKTPVFKFGEFLVFVGFAFHALNGIRLILIEWGLAVGKAEEPVYPYRSSLNTQRPLMVIMMVLAAILMAAGGYNIFLLG
ncbi:MAG: succinate dehydrogenase, cytochrome b556 subunit [Deltaproteobacteria bacterium]|nr:succinate dehydrogenase, cytochrome b556 subunit [Deltaproteobacteria bacterium]